MRATAGIAAIAAALWLATSVARAQPNPGPKDEARKEFEKAEAHYQHGEYAQAIEHYQSAYELSRIPALLFNVAQAYRLNGDAAKALDTYDEFVKLAPDHELAAEAKDRIVELRRQLTQSEAAPTEARPPEPSPPGRQPSFEQPVERDVPPDGSGGGGRGLQIGGMVAAGVGVVALGAGGWFGWRARSLEDELNGPIDEPYPDDPIGKQEDGERAERNMFILVGTGTGLVATGAVLYYLGIRADAEGGRGVAVAPAPLPGGAGLSFVGRF